MYSRTARSSKLWRSVPLILPLRVRFLALLGRHVHRPVELVKLLLQKGGHLVRLLDRVELGRERPRVPLGAEEGDEGVAREEAPAAAFRGEVSAQPVGVGFVAGGPFEGLGVGFHGDEAGHEVEARRRQELDFLADGASGWEVAVFVAGDRNVLDGEARGRDVLEVVVVELEPFVDGPGGGVGVSVCVQCSLTEATVLSECRSHLEGFICVLWRVSRQFNQEDERLRGGLTSVLHKY